MNKGGGKAHTEKRKKTEDRQSEKQEIKTIGGARQSKVGVILTRLPVFLGNLEC